jgi:hypothetical protein
VWEGEKDREREREGAIPTVKNSTLDSGESTPDARCRRANERSLSNAFLELVDPATDRWPHACSTLARLADDQPGVSSLSAIRFATSSRASSSASS